MATQDKDVKVKNGLQVGGPTNLVNYTSSSPSNPFVGQLWVAADEDSPEADLSSYLTLTAASAFYLTKTDAQSTYLPISASSDFITENTANGLYDAIGSASAAEINANAYTASAIANASATFLSKSDAQNTYLPISGSVNWSNINNKPDLTITLGGDLSGSATFTYLANGTLNATIATNSVELGVDTTGNYVSGLTAGNGISITGTQGEGWSPTVSINSSTASVSFSNISGKPSTLSGYGITDALPISASSNFAPLVSPSFTGTVTANSFIGEDGLELPQLNVSASGPTNPGDYRPGTLWAVVI